MKLIAIALVAMFATPAFAVKHVCFAQGRGAGKTFTVEAQDRISRTRAENKALAKCQSVGRACVFKGCNVYSGKF